VYFLMAKIILTGWMSGIRLDDRMMMLMMIEFGRIM